MLKIPVLLAAMDADTMKNALMLLYIMFAILAFGAIVYTVLRIVNKKGSVLFMGALWGACAIALICCILCLNRYRQSSALQLDTPAKATTEQTETTDPEDIQPEPDIPEDTTAAPTDPEPTEPPTEPDPTITPSHSDDTDPAAANVNWQIYGDGEIVDSFQRENPVYFGKGEDYYPLPGVPTFRGNNYRTGATYGTAQVSQEKLTNIWTKNVGGFNGWHGIGWTGQPLVVQWDAQTRANLGIYESKKNKDNLVEVIVTTLDGNIYFYDLEDGSYTRDPFRLGMNVKGTASLDPRGWPILYVGSGIPYNGSPKMFMISLIDNTLLYKQDGLDAFSKRSWYAFDSSPMICAEADTIIWPGESGVLYSLKLNAQYDPQAGTVSVNPETVAKTRYTNPNGRTVGYECSVIIVEQYAYLGDNGGLFFCVDLNTMELVWVQDVGDDVNATPVFEWGEDGIGYLYLGTSMEYGKGTSRIFKLNANNGEIVWETAFNNIVYNKDVSGGVLSSPLLGQKGTDLEGLILFAVGKTPNDTRGILVALDTTDGSIRYEYEMSNYAWSSIGAYYTQEGKTYVVLGDSVGNVRLFDSQLKELYKINIGSNIEASPVVFNDILIVGTRGGNVCGIQIS